MRTWMPTIPGRRSWRMMIISKRREYCGILSDGRFKPIFYHLEDVENGAELHDIDRRSGRLKNNEHNGRRKGVWLPYR